MKKRTLISFPLRRQFGYLFLAILLVGTSRSDESETIQTIANDRWLYAIAGSMRLSPFTATFEIEGVVGEHYSTDGGAKFSGYESSYEPTATNAITAHRGSSTMYVSRAYNENAEGWVITFVPPVQAFSLWTYDLQAEREGDAYLTFLNGETALACYGLNGTAEGHGFDQWAFNGYLSTSANISEVRLEAPAPGLTSGGDAIWYDDISWWRPDKIATFEEFVSDYFPPEDQTDPAHSDPDADPDHDEIALVREYVHALDPTKADREPFSISSNPWTEDDPSPGIEFTFPWRDGMTDASYSLESGDNLLGWLGVDFTTEIGPPIDGVRQITLRVELGATPPTRGFFRLAIEVGS